jgi:hypothetical protein
VDFGGVTAHDSAEEVLTLGNCTSLDIDATPMAISGPQSSLFTIDRGLGMSFTVPAQTSVGVVVSYAPLSASSSDSATLVIDESVGGTLNIPLQGHGL